MCNEAWQLLFIFIASRSFNKNNRTLVHVRRPADHRRRRRAGSVETAFRMYFFPVTF